MSGFSRPGLYAAACTDKAHRDRGEWLVVQYKCNHSTFNGGRWTRSDYSEVQCQADGKRWRTKAAYVETLSHVI